MKTAELFDVRGLVTIVTGAASGIGLAYAEVMADNGARVTLMDRDESSLDAAVKRLALALDALDAAVERRRQADRNEEGLAAQVQALGVDRTRLAAALDGETARSRRLETTNREIAERLDNAIASIQSVLDLNE